MLVRELIEQLGNYDGDTEVVISSDAEGNSFNFVDDMTVEDVEVGYKDEEVKDALIIWPV